MAKRKDILDPDLEGDEIVIDQGVDEYVADLYRGPEAEERSPKDSACTKVDERTKIRDRQK